MAHETVVRGRSRRVRGADKPSWRPVAAVVLISLAIRCLQLWALKTASGAQAATRPSTPYGTPFEYFVHAPTTASPGLGPVLGNWDGQWYMRIAELGYPRAEQMQSATDAWASAFPPDFPMLARATIGSTGLPFVWASLVLNTVLVLIPVVLLFYLLRTSGQRDRIAAAAAIGVTAGPLQPGATGSSA